MFKYICLIIILRNMIKIDYEPEFFKAGYTETFQTKENIFSKQYTSIIFYIKYERLTHFLSIFKMFL